MIAGRATMTGMRILPERKYQTKVLGSNEYEGMKNILVVDDDISFLTSLAEMVSLIQPSYDVMTAENGDQAISILRTLPVDLLITDIRMPVVPGSELVLWMRENMPRTPVIVISASNDTDLVSSIEGVGYFFFDKPLDVTRLIQAISSLMKEENQSTHI